MPAAGYLMSETERFAPSGSLDSDAHWSQCVSRGRIGRRTRKLKPRKCAEKSIESKFRFFHQRCSIHDCMECQI